MFFDEGFKPETDKLDLLIYKEIFPDYETEENRGF